MKKPSILKYVLVLVSWVLAVGAWQIRPALARWVTAYMNSATGQRITVAGLAGTAGLYALIGFVTSVDRIRARARNEGEAF